ncbi:MAG: archaellar assembly protein FlaJ [Thermoplasmata archaeon]|jgi:flagellar protein FlaJ|nr:archaellar assembly protein FlaJ [Thermoplasmata archaeon]
MTENKFVRMYKSMDMPVTRYFTRYALPLVILGIVLTAVLVVLLPELATDRIFRYLFVAIPVMTSVVAILIPLLMGERKKMQIERNMHLFLIRMSVLATSKLPRKKMLEILSQVKEYEALSDEVEKIYKLMEYWNMGMSDAARTVARRTPSLLLADFLDRLAHSSDAGEDMEEFLTKEREVAMSTYLNKYDTSLKDIDLLLEIFVAVLISLMFILVFIALLPVFINTSITLILPAVALCFVGIEGFVLYLVKSFLPSDPVWHNMKEKNQVDRTLKTVLPTTYAACIALVVFAIMVGLPITAVLALSVTPLIYPGFMIRKEEKRVRARDENYDSFIRAVGGYAATAGAAVTDGIGRLSKHDFGELTESVTTLYRRLLTRIDQIRAWNMFAADSGSNLISKFTEMYVVGLAVGGKVDQVIDIISGNFVKLMNVRRKRYQAADNMLGTMYGMSIGITFTLFSALSLMELLNDMNSQFALSQTTIVLPIALQSFDLSFAEGVFMFIVMVHSLISANIVTFAGGGHKHSFYINFAMITWISTVTAIVTQLLLKTVLQL